MDYLTPAISLLILEISDLTWNSRKIQNPIPQFEKWGLYPHLFGAAFFSMK
jgi:hypothetical protein